jgi:hypothetical protein
MKQILIIALIVAAAALALLTFGFLVPVHLPFQLDFQVLWHANLGILQGEALYEQAGPDALPFPYPPWYALSTLFLAALPIDAAARVWLGLNLLMLFGSTWIMTAAWPARGRLIAFLLVPMFPPVLGTLLVGQFVFPVLLGAVLLMHSLQRKNIGLVAVGASLLMFKPHLGLLPLLAGLAHLWFRRDPFGRGALLAVAGAGGLLFAGGFVVQPGWPLHYLDSLTAFRSVPGVSSCDLCASFPVWLVRLTTEAPGLAAAVPIATLLLAALLAVWLRWRPGFLRSPRRVISTTILFTLLASPYLLNYDFVLLLIPLVLLAGGVSGKLATAALAITYLLPWPALGLLGRAGNVVFSFGALLLLMTAYGATRELDAPGAWHYNDGN